MIVKMSHNKYSNGRFKDSHKGAIVPLCLFHHK